MAHNAHYDRMCAAKNAARGSFRVLESIHGLEEVVVRRAGVVVERPRVGPSQFECDIMTLAKNASRDGYRFAHQRLGFFEAL